MREMIKFLMTVIVFISFQSGFGQDNTASILFNDINQAIENSEYDIVIRMDKDMNDAQMNSLIKVLKSFVADIEVSYTRDRSGHIKTLKSSGGPSRGYCESEDFDFLIIALKENEWKGCRISDKG